MSASELKPPAGNFFNAECVIGGFISNRAVCFGSDDREATRLVFNVSTLGRTGLSALANVGDMFYDCGYNPALTNPESLVTLAERFPVGSVVPCYVDLLWALPFTVNSRFQPLASKDFILLDFTSSTLSSWSQTASLRTAGLVLGYLWISWSFVIVYGFFALMAKACCR